MEKESFICDCGSEILMIWDFEPWEDEPHHSYVEVYTQTGYKLSMPYRLKLCWAILRGKSHYLDGMVFSHDTMKKLAEFLSRKVEEADANGDGSTWTYRSSALKKESGGSADKAGA